LALITGVFCCFVLAKLTSSSKTQSGSEDLVFFSGLVVMNEDTWVLKKL